MSNKASAEEKRWKAENDAHTLAEAETIKADKSRLSAARKVAETQATEMRDRANAMSRIAGKGPSPSNGKGEGGTKSRSGGSSSSRGPAKAAHVPDMSKRFYNG